MGACANGALDWRTLRADLGFRDFFWPRAVHRISRRRAGNTVAAEALARQRSAATAGHGSETHTVHRRQISRPQLRTHDRDTELGTPNFRYQEQDRRTKSPTIASRCLLTRPRCRCPHCCQDPMKICVDTDSDWRGDPITGRSAIAGMLHRGRHLMDRGLQTQATYLLVV